MNKQRVSRTPLLAVIAVLAFFAVPAAAQAHHIDVAASCTLVDNAPTVTYKVDFVGFSEGARGDVDGTVKVDGTTRTTVVNSSGITWNGANGSISGTGPGVADAMSTVLADFTWPGGSEKESKKTVKCPKPTFTPNPAIELDKTGADTAEAGSTFTYHFKATNIGNVTLTNVQLSDPQCQSTLTRVEPNLADATFDPGDEWYYTCTVVAPAGPAQVDNVAEVCGDYPPGPTTKVCDDNPHTFIVPPPPTPPETPPVTPPADTPPGSTPSGTPPAGEGDVLPEEVISGRAVLRGPSGCVKQAFTARVSGRAIKKVTFSVDGRRIKTDTKSSFAVKINPNRYGFGRHRVNALVQFKASSGTKARRLPLTFRRCAQGAVAPRFTG